MSIISNLDTGRSVDDLALELKEDKALLHLWANRTPLEYHYYTFSIPKRSGKLRRIDAPNDILKSLQQNIYRRFLKYEAYQTAATGFVPERSILDNAKPHLKAKILIKIDLKDFFTSTSERRVYNFWKHQDWNDETAKILTRICCKDGGLPQGAPTSPALSNLVNRAFDGRVVGMVESYGVRYTRYADDLTFSFPRVPKNTETIRALIRNVKTLIEKEGYEIQLGKKIKILRPHQRQIVTGLLVNEKINLPRKTRNLIRALKHQRELGLLSEVDLKRLNGYEILSYMIDKENPDLSVNTTDSSTKSSSDVDRSVVIQGDVYFKSNVNTSAAFHGVQNTGDNNSITTIHNSDVKDSKSTRSRANKIAVAGIVITTLVGLIAIFASFSGPEIRAWLCQNTSYLCKSS